MVHVQSVFGSSSCTHFRLEVQVDAARGRRTTLAAIMVLVDDQPVLRDNDRPPRLLGVAGPPLAIGHQHTIEAPVVMVVHRRAGRRVRRSRQRRWPRPPSGNGHACVRQSHGARKQ